MLDDKTLKDHKKMYMYVCYCFYFSQFRKIQKMGKLMRKVEKGVIALLERR